MCPGQHWKTAVSLSKCFTAVIATILVFGTDTSYKLKWFWFLRTKTTGMITWRRLRSQYPEPSQKFLGIATLNSLPGPVYAVPDNYYFYNLLLMVCGAQNKHSSWLVWCSYSNLFFYLNRLIMSIKTLSKNKEISTKMFVYIWLDISPDLIVGSCILFV